MRRLKSHISHDVFLHIPPPKLFLSTPPSAVVSVTGEKPTKPKRKLPLKVIFFVTGNPGLIGYYREFLSLLVESSLTTTPTTGEEEEKQRENEAGLGLGYEGRVVVAGFSLAGFEIDVESDGEEDEGDREREGLREILFPSTVTTTAAKSGAGAGGSRSSLKKKDGDVYGLEEQVELSFARLEALVVRLLEDVEERSKDPENYDDDGVGGGHDGSATDIGGEEKQEGREVEVEVILMGHSVGAYIALEMVRLWHERCTNKKRWKPTAAILLTPTIMDIARSRSGRVATPVLSFIPFFPQLVQFASRLFLTRALSESWVKWVVARVTGMREESTALEVTTTFLRSERGVRQALHMARDEMAQIGREMPWDEEVVSLRTYFWFAKEDHWVADETRDEIMRRRDTQREIQGDDGGGRTPTTTILVDQADGLVHAWCINQSRMVARRVIQWIEQIHVSK